MNQSGFGKRVEYFGRVPKSNNSAVFPHTREELCSTKTLRSNRPRIIRRHARGNPPKTDKPHTVYIVDSIPCDDNESLSDEQDPIKVADVSSADDQIVDSCSENSEKQNLQAVCAEALNEQKNEASVIELEDSSSKTSFCVKGSTCNIPGVKQSLTVAKEDEKHSEGILKVCMNEQKYVIQRGFSSYLENTASKSFFFTRVAVVNLLPAKRSSLVAKKTGTSDLFHELGSAYHQKDNIKAQGSVSEMKVKETINDKKHDVQASKFPTFPVERLFENDEENIFSFDDEEETIEQLNNDDFERPEVTSPSRSCFEPEICIKEEVDFSEVWSTGNKTKPEKGCMNQHSFWQNRPTSPTCSFSHNSKDDSFDEAESGLVEPSNCDPAFIDCWPKLRKRRPSWKDNIKENVGPKERSVLSIQLVADILGKSLTQDEVEDWSQQIRESADTQIFERLITINASEGLASRRYKCYKCPTQIIGTAADVQKHMSRVHILALGFGCLLCPLSRLTEKALEKHESLHLHPQQKYVCWICDWSYFENRNAKIDFDWQSLHFRCHPSLRALSKLRPEEQVVVYKKCTYPNCKEEGFTTRYNFQRHVRTVHWTYEVICDICGKGMNCLKLMTHRGNCLKAMAGQRCELCGKILRNVLHNRHDCTGKYDCVICGARLFDSNSLSRHKIKVHGGRTFLCEVCGVAFDKQTGLKDHMNYHTGETPYECLVCSSRKITRSSLALHLRLFHKLTISQMEKRYCPTGQEVEQSNDKMGCYESATRNGESRNSAIWSGDEGNECSESSSETTNGRATSDKSSEGEFDDVEDDAEEMSDEEIQLKGQKDKRKKSYCEQGKTVLKTKETKEEELKVERKKRKVIPESSYEGLMCVRVEEFDWKIED